MWKYGRFESFPSAYDDVSGFVLFDRKDGWRELPLVEIHQYTGMMSKSAFDATYPDLPPIPSAARHSGE
jgi:hypothetical protein